MTRRLVYTLLVLHSAMMLGRCCGRKKESHDVPFHIHPNDTLPGDLQISTFLPKGQDRSFFYTSHTDRGALSLTLIACSLPVLWSFAADNATAPYLQTTSMDTLHVDAPARLVYTLRLLARDAATRVHVYVSTEEGGPQALQKAKFAKLRLLKRQKGKRLTVKWNPSLVDPQGTDYCVTVTSLAPVGSLCAAQILQSKDLEVACVGRRTHHTIDNLNQGQKYFFNIFAINHQTNFTYPYASTSSIFDGRFRHTSLKDGKLTFANLKKLDGKAVFRYKVQENATKSLDLYVIPCGGAIDVEVTLKDTTVIPPKRVKSFLNVSIPDPVPSARYYIKIFALNREELKKSSGVEVYATTRFQAKIPLPTMPRVVKLQEYKGLSTCDSVTVGWMAAPGQKSVHYCWAAKEGRIRGTDDFRISNQCGLESRLKKSVDFTVKYCKDIKYDDKEQVVVQKINQLKPGRYYVIQVTAKKPKGKTLSYDLLQVRTKHTCKKKDQ